MKKTLILCSLFGLVGVAGFFLSSKQLMAFLIFFLLLMLIPLKETPDFPAYVHRSVRNSFIFTLLAYGTIFLFSAILAKTPMIVEQMQFDVLLLIFIQALSWCFVLTIAVFVLQVILFPLISTLRRPVVPSGKDEEALLNKEPQSMI